MNQKLLTLFQKYQVLYQGESEDEKLVYVAAKRIEELLTHTLLKFFLKNPSSEKDILFGSGSPLSRFGVKISTAQRLGLISQGLAAEIRALKQVKKEFKDRLECVNFEYPAVKALCEGLWAPARMKNQPQFSRELFADTPRGNFELTAVLLSSLLENILDQTEEIKNTPHH